MSLAATAICLVICGMVGYQGLNTTNFIELKNLEAREEDERKFIS